MSEPFVGEIRMFAGNFAPRGWATCEGQLLAISQNDALFSLLGTIYGGDGRTTFGLPDLRGRVPVHAGSGSGPGLSLRRVGARGGLEQTTLTALNTPAHTHALYGSRDLASDDSPAGNVPATGAGVNLYGAPDAPTAPLDAGFVADATGGGASHSNMMPFLSLTFIIALFGIYPSRS